MQDDKITMCVQVARLLYTNSGVGVVALGSNGVQRLWKWARSEQNPTGKVLPLITLFIILLSIISLGLGLNTRNSNLLL